jgi:hypothetical protein
VEPQDVAALDGRRGPVAVASYGDLCRIAPSLRHIILFEHGAGFSFSTLQPSYAGGVKWRCLVSLFVAPNEYVSQRNKQVYPTALHKVVGCPKLDTWHLNPPHPQNPQPVIALTFHWNCRICPETRWAFPWFVPAIPALAEQYKVIAHAHPRAAAAVKAVTDPLGIEWVDDFEDVMGRADLLINDASSVLYEFASTDRPVVVLNAPWYRRRTHHGLRFWEHADVGVNCDNPEDLLGAVEEALEDTRAQQYLRQMAVEETYPVCDGTASAKAAELLNSFESLVLRRSLRPCPVKTTPLRPAGDCGVLIIAMGDKARAGAAYCVESLKRWHHGFEVVIVSNQPHPAADQTIIRDDVDVTCRSLKTAMDALSPYEYTLYLDADTSIVGPLDHGFRALDQGWDMALALDYNPTIEGAKQHNPWELNATAKVWGGRDFGHYNSGVVFFHRTAAVSAFMRAWAEEWRGGYDQMAFLRALRAQPVKLWLLGQAWNTHLSAQATHVWHQHHTVERTAPGEGRRRTSRVREEGGVGGQPAHRISASTKRPARRRAR